MDTRASAKVRVRKDHGKLIPVRHQPSLFMGPAQAGVLWNKKALIRAINYACSSGSRDIGEDKYFVRLRALIRVTCPARQTKLTGHPDADSTCQSPLKSHVEN